jgi:hypothetical protein
MLIGHYAPALLLKTRAPKVPLWSLFIAVEVLDYLWSLFILFGLEHMRFAPESNPSNGLELFDMPYSHSLAATVVWSLVGFTIAFALRRDWKLALAIALGVASHFVCDWVVHIRDLPLLGNDSTKLGLGLWSNRFVAVIVETIFFVGSLLIFQRTFGWKSRRWLGLAGVMSVLCVAGYFVPPPPTSVALAVSGFGLYVLFPFLAWKAEKGEITSGGASSPSPG